MSAALAVWGCAAAELWSHAQRGHVTAAARSLPAAWHSAQQGPRYRVRSGYVEQRQWTNLPLTMPLQRISNESAGLQIKPGGQLLAFQ